MEGWRGVGDPMDPGAGQMHPASFLDSPTVGGYTISADRCCKAAKVNTKENVQPTEICDTHNCMAGNFLQEFNFVALAKAIFLINLIS